MDSNLYPANFFTNMRLKGRIDPDRFATAYRKTIDRHPLLSSSFEIDRRGRPRWIEAPTIEPIKHQKVTGESNPFETRSQIDLTQTNGIRCRIIENGDDVCIFNQYHHSCCDGMGAFRFMTDLIHNYAVLSGFNRMPPLRPTNPAWLLDRAKLKYGLTTKLHYLREVMSMPFHNLAPLLPVDDHPRADFPEGYPTMIIHEHDRETTAALRAAAKKQGTSLYKLMLRDYHWTIDRFRKDHAPDWQPKDWIRLVAPVSIRETSEQSLSTENCVSSYLIDRRQGDIDDPAEHSKWFLSELDRQCRHRLLHGLLWYQKLGLAFFRKTMLRLCRCLTVTSTFTDMTLGWLHCKLPKGNNGRHIASDDLIVDHVEGFAPLRQNTIVAVCCMIYDGRLRTTFNYDSRFITKKLTESLKDLYVKRLCENLDESSIPAI